MTEELKQKTIKEIEELFPINDCYKCKYRRPLPGNTHSQCVFPLALSPGAGIKMGEEKIFEFITINEYGKSQGWAYFPYNFDPIWIECRFPIKHKNNEQTESLSENS